MIPCTSLNNTKFQPGGIYENVVIDPKNPDDNWTLCPETGDLNYSGFAGTNLWIIPKGNLNDSTIVQEFDPHIEIDF